MGWAAERREEWGSLVKTENERRSVEPPAWFGSTESWVLIGLQNSPGWVPKPQESVWHLLPGVESDWAMLKVCRLLELLDEGLIPRLWGWLQIGTTNSRKLRVERRPKRELLIAGANSPIWSSVPILVLAS